MMHTYLERQLQKPEVQAAFEQERVQPGCTKSSNRRPRTRLYTLTGMVSPGSE
jgi:hypothetical protein